MAVATVPGTRPKRGVCSIEGCDNPHASRGWCVKHYQRWRNRGTTDDPPPPTIRCSVQGCSKPHESYGFCQTHAQRWKKYGSTSVTWEPYTFPAEVKESDFAYAAGLIDGEGCITICEKPSTNCKERRSLFIGSIQVAMCDEAPLTWLKATFGGYYYKKLRPQKRPVWRWEIQTRGSYALIPHLLPYLKVKRQQAELVYRLVHDSERAWATSKALTATELARRQQLVREIRNLNLRGVAAMARDGLS